MLWRCRHWLSVWGVAESVGFSFALKVLPIIVFFAALIAVLYHVGIMKWIIPHCCVLGTSRAESMSATANIFVGQTEAPRVKTLHRHHDPIGIVRQVCCGLCVETWNTSLQRVSCRRQAGCWQKC